MIEYLGYIGALCIGLILGLTGGGGSILTVPILVYIMGIDAVAATGYSLFVVGTTSLFGTFKNLNKGTVAIKTALLFAIPSLIGVFLTRRFFVPLLPKIIYADGDFVLTKDKLLMLIFASLMLVAAISMLRKKDHGKDAQNKPQIVLAVAKIFLIGVLIGTVGAGGGFLFVPFLIFVGKLPIKKAVATSLAIMSINSLIGFTGDIGHLEIAWSFLLIFTAISIVGIFLGIYLQRFINDKMLARGFAIFVLCMSFFIFGRELFFGL